MKVKIKREHALIIFIVCAALFFRIYKIDTIPPAASWDEISIGYNAYSILKTGMDEHQRHLPLDTFVAFGDYKPPLSIYLTVPFIAFFGNSELAIRLPSALAGTMSVFLTYLIVSELFKNSAELLKQKYLPLFSATLLAISPWHLQLSRAGFEANIALMFMLLGVYYFLTTIRISNFFYVCWLPFVAAMYTFNSARYFTPILAIVLIWFGRKVVRINLWKFIIGIVISIIIMFPIMPHLVSKEARLRFREVNIFNDYPLIYQTNNRIKADGYSIPSKVLHNWRLVYARSYLIHFFDNFQPWFLFVRGDGNPKFSIQDVGELYLIEAPFLLLGMYELFRKNRNIAILLFLWLLGAVVPAATARETPHALRIENSLPVWQIFIATGVLIFLSHVKGKRFRIFVVSFVALLYCGSFSYYLHNYFNHYPSEFSGEWQYGYREAFRYTEKYKNTYDRIVVSEIIGRPYIYALFYGEYDPVYFWATADAGFDAAGFYNVAGFGKYRFTRVGIDTSKSKTLYVLPPELVPKKAHILERIKLLNSQTVLVIFD